MAAVLAVAFIAAGDALAQTATPGPGISLELATRRAAIIRDLRYELTLTVPRDPKQALTGTMTARFRLSDASQPLVFDFAPGADSVTSVSVGGRSVRHTWVTDHIVVPASALAVRPDRGAHRVHGRRCLAQPQSRLPVCALRPGTRASGDPGVRPAGPEGALDAGTAPPGRLAGGQQRRAGRRRSTSGRHDRGGDGSPRPSRCRPTSFPSSSATSRSSRPSATAARSASIHRETDAAKVARNRDAIFDLHARALAFMEDYTGIPYAFGKFDFVAIPAFQFGGMEHAGQGALQRVAACCSTNRRRRTSSSAAPRSSRTRPRTCGSAISSRCAGSTTCG